VHELESHSKSPEMAQFVMLYIASYLWSVVAMSLSCTVSQVLPLSQYT